MIASNPRTGAAIRHKARQLSRQPGFVVSDQPDLEQELWLHLCERVSRFDPTIASLSTFVARIVDHKAASIVRHRRAQKRHPRREDFSLDEPDIAPTGEVATNGEAYTRLDLARDLHAVLDELPEPDRTVAYELGSGSLLSAARKLGLTRAQARTIKDRLRERFEDGGLDEYL